MYILVLVLVNALVFVLVHELVFVHTIIDAILLMLVQVFDYTRGEVLVGVPVKQHFQQIQQVKPPLANSHTWTVRLNINLVECACHRVENQFLQFCIPVVKFCKQNVTKD